MAQPEHTSLAGILSDEKPDPVEQQTETTTVIEPAPAAEPVERSQSKRKAWQDKEQGAQGRVRDPNTGQFVPKTEAAAEKAAPAKEEQKKEEPAKAAAPAAPAPQQEFTEKEKAFLRAAQEERQKRQALEQRLAALEGNKPQPGATTEAKKGFWDDPDGALARHRQETEQTVQTTVVNARLNLAETIARSQHPDFDEKVAAFRDILTNAGPNAPVIAQQWLAAPDPAMYAYNLGKNHMELQQVGNLDALRSKIEKDTEARVRATMEAEYKTKQEALERERAALPGSLSDARSTGTNRRVWGGPTALDDVLKG
jgi:hypothetical protein